MSDNFERDVTSAIDSYIDSNGLANDPEELPRLRDGFNQPIIDALDLRKDGINTIIRSTGYTFDYSLVKLPVLDTDGFPIQSTGVIRYPGLYFVAMPWMPAERTGTLFGVGESAGRIVSTIMGLGKVEGRMHMPMAAR